MQHFTKPLDTFLRNKVHNSPFKNILFGSKIIFCYFVNLFSILMFKCGWKSGCLSVSLCDKGMQFAWKSLAKIRKRRGLDPFPSV